ncbi:IclR family transcriptional regulator C-terminal domain-containing protein [Pigmentiphaga soli]|uniref:IclR family transcriptional regulator C-terminal domain-containing protein n=1 Tax=Pigmentiphaga soli TaxID=1007095 RepID=A0ABP8GBY2_9BURK
MQSIDRALVILRELARAPQGLSALELSRRTEIERTTIHRLLKTLMHWNMIAADNGVYSIGPECLVFATAHVDRLNVRRAALPYAVELQEKILKGRSALVSISVPARDEIVIIERVWTPLTPMNVIMEIGNHFPIDVAASGLAILSTYSEKQCLDAIGAERLARVEPALRKIRQADGFSCTQGRFKPGLISLACPVYGKGTAALGAVVISGLELEEEMRPQARLVQHLRRVCQSVSASLRAS